MSTSETDEAATGYQAVPVKCDGSDSGIETSSAGVQEQPASCQIYSGSANSKRCSDLFGAFSSLSVSLEAKSITTFESTISPVLTPQQHLEKNGKDVVEDVRSCLDCCSENGSESSSTIDATRLTERYVSLRPKATAVKTEGIDTEDCGKKSQNSSMKSGHVSGSSSIYSSLRRTSSLQRPSALVNAARNVDILSSMKLECVGQDASTSASRIVPERVLRPKKPDSLPSALCRTQSNSMQRLVQRTPSMNRSRTPGTPSDDGRWPSNNKSIYPSSAMAKRATSVNPDFASLKKRTSTTAAPLDIKPSTSSSTYNTIPRRRRQKSVEDLTFGKPSPSNAVLRDMKMSSSVVVSARKSLVNSFGGTTANTVPHSKSFNAATTLYSNRIGNMRQQPYSKTRIFHETSAQTVLKSADIEQILTGSCITARAVDAIEQSDQATQTDIRDREIEKLYKEVGHLEERERDLNAKLQKEREDKLSLQHELNLNAQRIMAILDKVRVVAPAEVAPAEIAKVEFDNGNSAGGDFGGTDSLLMLESQIQMSGHELLERQQEINQLRQLCRTLQLEVERSLAGQQCLLREKAEIEQESYELHDFLQQEKITMCDAFKELESEYELNKRILANRDEEIKVLRDECRHLVRLNEQRRQEYRLFQSRYTALHARCTDLMMQENSSVAGASAALSGLHMRLDNLVSQLVSSYNISEQDLEASLTIDCESCRDGEKVDNTTLKLPLVCNQNQLPDQLNDGSLSPQRYQSFIAAVIGAIRNATTPSKRKHVSLSAKAHEQQGKYKCNKRNDLEEDSDSTDMLDSETEPCLMMDNVLEDVTIPDSHSHNMVSSGTAMISQIDVPSELVKVNACDDSLQNLSQAIAKRQQMEQKVNAMCMNTEAVKFTRQQNNNSLCDDVSCSESMSDMPSLMEHVSVQAVLDQVFEVDHLITKLLKVLRLIQIDSDSCIQQLIVDKNKLQQNKEDILEKLKDLQDVNIKLQDELMDATQELMLKNNELSNSKTELQRHRNEIDVRF